uniref:hypothetical protein n=1 Tax=Roseomonas rosulenta TaxID=2748667 RepID=UPI0018E03611
LGAGTPACLAQPRGEARAGRPATMPLPPGSAAEAILEVPVLAYRPAATGVAGLELRLVAPGRPARVLGRIEIFPLATFDESDPPRVFRFRLPPEAGAEARIDFVLEGSADPEALFRLGTARRLRPE